MEIQSSAKPSVLVIFGILKLIIHFQILKLTFGKKVLCGYEFWNFFYLCFMRALNLINIVQCSLMVSGHSRVERKVFISSSLKITSSGEMRLLWWENFVNLERWLSCSMARREEESHVRVGKWSNEFLTPKGKGRGKSWRSLKSLQESGTGEARSSDITLSTLLSFVKNLTRNVIYSKLSPINI